MIARLREEAEQGTEPREAADLAIEHGGPSVAAAGLILAGTFSSLMLAGMALLTEMGFSVAAGIVISAFLMSIFLVPSVTALLGDTGLVAAQDQAALEGSGGALPGAGRLIPQTAGRGVLRKSGSRATWPGTRSSIGS